MASPLFILSGCRDDDPCADDPDSKHCYQGEAVSSGDPSVCDKIS